MNSMTRTKKFGIGAALVAAAVVVFGGATLSNSYFSDGDTARVDINTATLSLGVSDADNSGTIDLDFNNLAPQQLISQSFTVRNDGTIPGYVKIGSNFSNSTPANPALNYNELRVAVGTVAGQTPLTPVTQLPASWDLGVLQPGESKTFVFDVKLGGSAGNEWQGQSFGGNIPVTLTQQP